jgi:protein SCO1/2
MEKGKQKYLLLIAALLIATGLVMWLANQGIMNTSSLPVLADISTDFELTAADGARIRLKDYRDRIVIVFFGYTSCPDVCPTGLYTLKQVMDKLGKDSGQDTEGNHRGGKCISDGIQERAAIARWRLPG